MVVASSRREPGCACCRSSGWVCDRTGSAALRIGGIYQANALIGSYLVSAGFFAAHFASQPPAALLLQTNGSGTVNDAVTSALAVYPNVQVQTRAQFDQTQANSVDQLVGLVYALLALAVLIALIGIVVGTGMGVALVSSLKQQGITDTVVPVSRLVVFLVIAAQLCAHRGGSHEAEDRHHRSFG